MNKYIAFLVLLQFAGISGASPSVSGVRDIDNQNIRAGQSTNISITITSTISQALALSENLPVGWTLERLSDDANVFKARTHDWVWFNVKGNDVKTIIYRMTVPAGTEAGTYNLEGSVGNSSGMIASITGEKAIIVLGSAKTSAQSPRVTVSPLVNANSTSVEKNSFEVSSIKSREPASTPAVTKPTEPVKAPGFTFPALILLIVYSVSKIKSRGGV